MAAGKLGLLSLPVLTFSHAPRWSPNIHTQARPHINATLEAGRQGAGGFSTLLLLSNGTAPQLQSSSHTHLPHCYISKYTHGSWLEVTVPLLIFIGWSYNFASCSALAPITPCVLLIQIHKYSMLVIYSSAIGND